MNGILPRFEPRGREWDCSNGSRTVLRAVVIGVLGTGGVPGTALADSPPRETDQPLNPVQSAGPKLRNPWPLIIVSGSLGLGMTVTRLGISAYLRQCGRQGNCPDGVGFYELTSIGLSGLLGVGMAVTGGIGFGWLGRKHAYDHYDRHVIHRHSGLGAIVAGSILTAGSGAVWVTSLVLWRDPLWLRDTTFLLSTFGVSAGVSTLTYGVGYRRTSNFLQQWSMTPMLGPTNGIVATMRF